MKIAQIIAHRVVVALVAIAFAFFAAGFFAAPGFAEDKTDVTSVVVAAVRNNTLSIVASNDAFGDTAPGIPKKLHVDYRIGDEKLESGDERRREDRDRGTSGTEARHHKGRVWTCGWFEASEYRRRR